MTASEWATTSCSSSAMRAALRLRGLLLPGRLGLVLEPDREAAHPPERHPEDPDRDSVEAVGRARGRRASRSTAPSVTRLTEDALGRREQGDEDDEQERCDVERGRRGQEPGRADELDRGREPPGQQHPEREQDPRDERHRAERDRPRRRAVLHHRDHDRADRHRADGAHDRWRPPRVLDAQALHPCSVRNATPPRHPPVVGGRAPPGVGGRNPPVRRRPGASGSVPSTP